MEKAPLTIEFRCGSTDTRAVFPLIERTGEDLILIPADLFEVAVTTEHSIILKRKKPLAP